MYALIFNGKVEQLEENRFEVCDSLTWVEILPGTDVAPGYLYDGNSFTPPPPYIPRREIDDIFRRAVKRIIVAILKYINGTITKPELGVIYNEVKDTLERINE